MNPLEKLGHEYMFSADKVKLRAKQLELNLKNNKLSENELENIYLRVETLKAEYRDTRKIGETLIYYYKKQ